MAAVLVVMVVVNAGLTGWLLRNEREVSRKYVHLSTWVESIADELAVRDHDAR